MHDVPTNAWDLELEELFLRTGARFCRVEARRRMRDYVRGLLGPVGRKNSWQLAEYVGHATPHGLQHLFSHSRWDADGLRDDLQAYGHCHVGPSDQPSDFPWRRIAARMVVGDGADRWAETDGEITPRAAVVSAGIGCARGVTVCAGVCVQSGGLESLPTGGSRVSVMSSNDLDGRLAVVAGGSNAGLKAR
jgi:hypothetical protein